MSSVINDVIKMIKDSKLDTYRYQTMRQDIGALLNVSDRWKIMRTKPKGEILSASFYPQTRKTMTTRYKTVIRVQGKSKITGELVTRHVTVAHDTLLSRDELEADALIVLEKSESPTKPSASYPTQAYFDSRVTV